MSAQAGIFYFDRRPVDPEVVSVMGRSLDDYGPDRAGEYVVPGLAMVHRIVDAHGGSISVDSGMGRGTVFNIRLPDLAPGQEIPAATLSSAAG